MKTGDETIAIPLTVLQSVDTLDELEDWLLGQNDRLMRELRQTRAEDLKEEFQPWKPRHAPCPTELK